MRRRKTIILRIVFTVAIAFAVLIVGRFIYVESERKSIIANQLQAGDTAPDFTVNLLSGDTFTLSENKGKVVFLNFWATWCAPCVAEMPAIQELSEEYSDDVIFIGVASHDSTNKIQDLITERGFTYPIGLDESGDVKDLYPSLSTSYTLVIDAEGVISEIFLGGSDQTHDEFEAAITEALNKQ
ncbi:TlpA family protein disulfide reductase [Christensenella intestinihominis]|uniref:TlpA family protein disulfide reductase n=1 Tax=Christensenella intestinihominis TaxID=1851429 RepID=UPI00082E7EB2|nr:TlpA disulfide reductase family protein [Christensenella intestinihominis]